MTVPTSSRSDRLAPHPRFGRPEATRLIWRAGLGGGPQTVEEALVDGFDRTVNRLVDGVDEPQDFKSTEDILLLSAIDGSDITHLKSWWFYRLIFSANPLHERLTLFWHNHFATSFSKVQSVLAMLDQNRLFRRHQTGSFGDLLHGISQDVAMLIWLDGNANRKRHPNENFARELMELFSLDVGNYSEKDIQEAARAFTGWHVRQNRFWFNKPQHDPGEKTVLNRTGPLNGDDVVEICLDQPACPRFLARKLLREFVCPEPSADDVRAVAELIHECDYQMAPVIKTLLKSRLFFDPAFDQRLIKSPVELIVGTMRTLQLSPNLYATVQVSQELGQDLFQPPTVKGWDGHRTWLNSATWLLRTNFLSAVVRSRRYGDLSTSPIANGQLDSHEDRLRFLQIVAGPSAAAAHPQLLRDSRDGNRTTADFLQLTLALPEYQLK